MRSRGLAVVAAVLAAASVSAAKLRHPVIAPIDEKPLERNLDITSTDNIFSGLEADGFVAVCGIAFEPDTADLKPGAARIHEEVARLLNARPELRVEPHPMGG